MQPTQPMKPAKNSLKASEARLGYLLIAPAFLLVVAVIFYPVLYNIWLSFNKVSLNPRRPDLWIGLENYQELLKDAAFWHSIGITLLYTVVTVVGATLAGLGTALLLNQAMKGRRFFRSILLLPYVAPVISLVFVWQYMFNPVYGMVNYSMVDTFHVFQERIDWLDSPGASFALVILFDIWHIFPFAFMMILAKLQTVDASLQEAAEIDGANAWKKFWYVTLPELNFVIGSLMILRFIWNFYKFDEVYLLTKEVPVIGVYTYETAFSTYNHGLAAAITVTLFVLVMVFVLFAVRKVLKW